MSRYGRAAKGSPIDMAYATCTRLAREHYENFPVASWLLPSAMRPHVAAVYAFARVADDFADEGDRPAAERLRLLDGWEAALRQAAGNAVGTETAFRRADGDAAWTETELRQAPGARTARAQATAPLPAPERATAPPGGPDAGGLVSPGDAASIFIALGETIRTCGLPVGLLVDLLSAFRQDVLVNRYQAWDEVLDYCRRSANPVGRLVLRIAGYARPDLDRASDALCTALQLTNFWQDLGRDWRRGRLYVPREVLDRHGASADRLDAGELDAAWLEVMAGLAARTRSFFDCGRAVCDGVGGRLRAELRLTWLGGTTILARVEAAGSMLPLRRPTLRPIDVPGLLWRALAWRT